MMAQHFGLQIVIGAAVGGALKGFANVIKQTDLLGTTLDRLAKHQKRVFASKPFSDVKQGIAAVEDQIKRLRTHADDLRLRIRVEMDEQKRAHLNRQLDAVSLRIETLNKKKIRIATNLDNLVKTDKRLRAIDHTIQTITKHQARLQAVQAKREAARSKLFDAVALGSTVFFPVKQAIDFESAMADVVKVANLNKQETHQVSQEMLRLSTKIPIVADGLAEISASGAQLGITKNRLKEFTVVVAKMGVAFDMGAKDAGDSIAKLKNIFNLSIKGVESLGDAINYLSDNTAAKASDMVNVMSRIGGSAKLFGLAKEQALALADAFLAMGKPPEVASTVINALLNKLSTADKQGKKFAEGLKQIGLTPAMIKLGIKNDPQKTIMLVLKSIKGLKKEAQMGVLTDLFGAEFSDDIALLVGGLHNYEKALKLVSDKSRYAGSMQKEFENRSKTTANSLKLLGNSVTRIGIELGSVLLPTIRLAATVLGGWADGIASVAQKFPVLSKVVAFGATALVAFGVASAIAGYAATFVVGGWSRAMVVVGYFRSVVGLTALSLYASTATTYAQSAALWTLGMGAKLASGALFMMRHPLQAIKIGLLALRTVALGTIAPVLLLGLKFVAIGVAIATAVYGWYKIFEWVKYYFAQFGAWVGDLFSRLGAWIGEKMSAPVQWIADVWQRFKVWISPLTTAIGNFFSMLGEHIAKVVSAPVGYLKNLWSRFLNWIGSKIDALKGWGNTIAEKLGFGKIFEVKVSGKGAEGIGAKSGGFKADRMPKGGSAMPDAPFNAGSMGGAKSGVFDTKAQNAAAKGAPQLGKVAESASGGLEKFREKLAKMAKGASVGDALKKKHDTRSITKQRIVSHTQEAPRRYATTAMEAVGATKPTTSISALSQTQKTRSRKSLSRSCHHLSMTSSKAS